MDSSIPAGTCITSLAVNLATPYGAWAFLFRNKARNVTLDRAILYSEQRSPLDGKGKNTGRIGEWEFKWKDVPKDIQQLIITELKPLEILNS